MDYLFSPCLDGWESWARIVQSSALFHPLIQQIATLEHLPAPLLIENLPPATNAVFRVGDLVYKIFAPRESGIQSEADYATELAGLQHARDCSIPTADIAAFGIIQDRYQFYYLVLKYIDAKDARSVLTTFSAEEKKAFVRRLRAMLDPFHQLASDTELRSLIQNAEQNECWNRYPPNIRMQVCSILEEYPFSTPVRVHGDLNGRNVLIDADKQIFLIDFADNHLAPVEYELPSLFFDLFDFDSELIHAFCPKTELPTIAGRCFAATLLHDFGGDFVTKILRRYRNQAPKELKDINEIKILMETEIFSK